MAVVRDWVAIAADEIKSAMFIIKHQDSQRDYVVGGDRIEEIIRKHCPFKEGVVYAPVEEAQR